MQHAASRDDDSRFHLSYLVNSMLSVYATQTAEQNHLLLSIS